MDRKSTGLKDINGKEIFVGDTVAYDEGCYGTRNSIDNSIVQEDMLDGYYIVTDDGSTHMIDDFEIMCHNVEKK